MIPISLFLSLASSFFWGKVKDSDIELSRNHLEKPLHISFARGGHYAANCSRTKLKHTFVLSHNYAQKNYFKMHFPHYKVCPNRTQYTQPQCDYCACKTVGVLAICP